MAKALFGILDAESAKSYDESIQKLSTDANLQFELLERQTILVQNTIRKQKSIITDTQNSLQLINKQIEEFTNSANNDQAEFQAASSFNTLATAATLTILRHEATAENIIKLLANALHGQTTNIIPADLLRSSLKQISQNAPANSR